MYTVVSIVSYKFLPARSGGQRGIALFEKYFAQQGKLICIATKDNEISGTEGYKILPLISNSPLRYINLFYFFTIRKIIKEYGASHILIEHPYYGWLAYLIRTFCRVKVVVHSHNIEGLRWKSLGKWWWPVLWQYEKFTHRIAHYNFFIQENDLDYAVTEFKLDRSRCTVITYGIERKEPPLRLEVEQAKETIRSKHEINRNDTILLFNGAFNYKPNLDALTTLLDVINPMLQKNSTFNYKLLICGSNIPERILNGSFPNVIVAGFVDDINTYFKSATVFLNPISDGGGIKTKLVEALGNNCNAVSTMNGAIGIDPDLCNGKLQVVADQDWENFAGKIFDIASYQADIDPAYYQHFFWGSIAGKAWQFIM